MWEVEWHTHMHWLTSIIRRGGGGADGGIVAVDGAQEPGLWEGGHACMRMSCRWTNPHTGR